MPVRDPALRNPIGTHVPVGAGLTDGALATAESLGCETLQVFVGNPRGWALAAGDAAEDARFRDALAERGMRVFIHAPYLVNLGSPTPPTYERSSPWSRTTSRGPREIGAEGVVVHTGSYVDPDGPAERHADGAAPGARGPAAAARRGRRRRRAVAAARADRGPGPLAVRRRRGPRAVPRRRSTTTPRPGSAWTPATSSPPARRWTSRVARPRRSTGSSRSAGRGRLRLIHANDSMDVRGAFKDRHQRIGEGHIGVGAFVELFAHPATDGVPFILETPGSRDAGQPRHPAAAAAARGRPSRRDRVDPPHGCSRPSPCSAMTACWGSTFFLIHDLLDRVPDPGLPGRPVRDRRAWCCSLIAPRAVRRLSPDARRQAARARRALRRRADPADRRAGAHPGQRLRLHHRHVRRLHAAVRRAAAAHPDHRG